MAAEAFSFFQQQWVVLSLLAALGYASIGYIDEWLLHRHGVGDDGLPADAAGKLIIISGLFGFVVSAFFALIGVLNGGLDLLQASTKSLALATLAGMFEIVWLIPYFYAMQRAGALNATPLFQSVPVFSLLFGALFFAEIPPLKQVIGAFVIATGAFVLNFNVRNWRVDWVTILLMFAASSMISFEYFFFKGAAIEVGFVTSAFCSGVGMVVATGLIWAGWPPYRKQFKRYLVRAGKFDLGVQVGNEGLNSASVLASQLAVVRGPSVMLVSAFNAFHPIFTLLIGWLLAKQGSKFHADEFQGGRSLQKSMAIALIAAGTAIVALW